MMQMLFINYPSWIHPEIFPGVPVLGLIRWYGLMYIFAFSTAFLVLKTLLMPVAAVLVLLGAYTVSTSQARAQETDR